MEKLTVSASITEVDDASNQLVKVYEQTPAVQNDALLKAIFDEMKSLSEQITEAILRDKDYTIPSMSVEVMLFVKN